MQSTKNPSRSYVYWMAWRHLRAQRGRAGLSFMTVVSIAGVTIGVAVLIVVLSVMGGFEADLKSKMLRGLPHIEVYAKTEAAGFSLKKYPLDYFRSQLGEVSGLQAFTKSDVILKNRKHLASVTLLGVDPKVDEKLWVFGSTIVEGHYQDLAESHLFIPEDWDEPTEYPGIVLGENLAAQLAVSIGDEVVALSPSSSVSQFLAGGTLSRRYVVVGIFAAQMFNFDSRWAVTSIVEGRKFMADYDPSLDEDEFVTGIAANTDKPMDVLLQTANLAQSKDFAVSTWQDVNSSLLFALKLEKFAMGSILMLIVLVAGFSISGTMMMTVYHRRGQVSLLRSIGMSQKDIRKLFLAHGFTIGTTGIVLGGLIGIGLCLVIHSFDFVSLPRGVYYLKSLPVRFLPIDYIVICFCAWVISLVASVYPAILAANQDPCVGLRYE